jgi:flagellar motor switch/type III secretory pathway protein FliN
LGILAELAEDGRLVLRGETEGIPTEAPMETVENDGLIAALGEVPVVVRVEIGEATMSAREWASVGRGDVLGLGRRVGELVIVRVGGVPLARGELVDLEGEIAVRIVERFVAEESPAR